MENYYFYGPRNNFITFLLVSRRLSSAHTCGAEHSHVWGHVSTCSHVFNIYHLCVLFLPREIEIFILAKLTEMVSRSFPEEHYNPNSKH